MKQFAISTALALTIATACSPLAPNVSKFSNAAAEKTTTTDSTSPSNDVAPGSASTLVGDSGEAAEALVLSQHSFQRKWSQFKDSQLAAFQLPWTAYHDLSVKGTATFSVPQSLVEGKEKRFIDANKYKVILVVSLNDNAIKSANLRAIPATVRYLEPNHEIEIHLPDLGTIESIDFSKLQKSVREKLVGAAIVFTSQDL